MPRKRDLAAYPTQYYWALVQRVVADGRILFPCERREAATIQGEFYTWRRVCEEQAEAAARLGVDVTQLRNVALRATEEGLLAMPESELLGPRILASVLGDVGQRVTSATPEAVNALAAAESLRRLRAMTGEGE